MWENTSIIPTHSFIFKTKKTYDLHSIIQRPERLKHHLAGKQSSQFQCQPSSHPQPYFIHFIRSGNYQKPHDVLISSASTEWSNVKNNHRHCYLIIILRPFGQYFRCNCCEKSGKQSKLSLLSSPAPPSFSLLPFYQLPWRKLTSAQPRLVHCGLLSQK